MKCKVCGKDIGIEHGGGIVALCEEHRKQFDDFINSVKPGT